MDTTGHTQKSMNFSATFLYPYLIMGFAFHYFIGQISSDSYFQMLHGVPGIIVFLVLPLLYFIVGVLAIESLRSYYQRQHVVSSRAKALSRYWIMSVWVWPILLVIEITSGAILFMW